MNTPAGPAAPVFRDVLRDLRRARQLSQLQLASLAATSQRHVSFLELGRSQPSRAMVLQLAEALALSLRERNRMLLAAGFAAIYPQRPLESADMQPVRQALERMLRHHEPFPAIVIDRRWDLVTYNAVAGKLFALAGDPQALWARTCPDGRQNVLRMICHPHGLRPHIRNFPEVARMMLGRVQREAEESAIAAEVLAEVLRDAELPARWQPEEPAPLPSPVFTTHLSANGASLKLFALISTFGTPQDVTADELRVGSFFPADEASEALLRAL